MKTTTFPNLLNDFVNLGFEKIFTDEQGPFVNKNLPMVNILETTEAYQLDMVAPGRTKSDFVINLDKNLLTISFTKKEEQKEENKKWIKKEFGLHSFKRTFTLSDLVDASKIEATYTDGILQIVVPKKEVAKVEALTIEVK